MITFGPVPSRRLGRSLGINNIPPKICTYSCVYCQLGRTIKMQVERRPFHDQWEILKAVQGKVKRLVKRVNLSTISLLYPMASPPWIFI